MSSEASSVKVIYKSIQDLVIHFCPSLPSDDQRKFARTHWVKLCCLTESSNHEEYDDITVGQRVGKQLLSLQKNESVSIFHELFSRFKKENVGTNVGAVMSFLVHMSEVRSGGHPGRLRGTPLRPRTLPDLHQNGDGVYGWMRNGKDGSPVVTLSPVGRPPSFTHSNSSKGFLCDSRDAFNNSQSPVAKLFHRTVTENHYKRPGVMAPEQAVLLDLVYSFQGISGEIIKADPQGNFVIDPQVWVKGGSVVQCLLEVGYLHNSLLECLKALPRSGSVTRAVVAAVKANLTDYYSVIELLHSQVCSEGGGEDTPLRGQEEGRGPRVSMLRLLSVMRGPSRLLQVLCDVVQAVTGCRGGAAISNLHLLTHHADSFVYRTVRPILNSAVQPLMKMLGYWLIHGELMDPYHEFFIGVNKNCQEKDIWHNKYLLRNHLIPNLISEKQANIILQSGKAVHFLNIICDQKCAVTGARLKLSRLQDADLVELSDEGSQLSRLLTAIYEETSALVLDKLINDFKLFQHFLGLRKYILLCQGDFANYLMDFLEPEMCKEAEKLQVYRLTGLLDAAIRASSAAFEEPDIIARVTVKLLVASAGDSGYDVFGLHYSMHECIEAAFRLNEGAYSSMFNFLWRMKRMWHMLQGLVRARWSLMRKLNLFSDSTPEVEAVLVLANRMSMELVHFARELQSYLMFEVIECVWDKFSESFHKAKTLDDIITAHDTFVSTIKRQTFHDHASKSLITEVRLVWELVKDVEGLERSVVCRLEAEADAAQERREQLDRAGTSDQQEADHAAHTDHLRHYLASVRAQYSIFIRNYQEVLKKLLLELSMSKDHQLRLLSSRLDYSEYYKRSDARITDSMKYSRCSEIFSEMLT